MQALHMSLFATVKAELYARLDQAYAASQQPLPARPPPPSEAAPAAEASAAPGPVAATDGGEEPVVTGEDDSEEGRARVVAERTRRAAEQLKARQEADAHAAAVHQVPLMPL